MAKNFLDLQAPLMEPPRFFGRSISLSALIAVMGLTLSLLLFYLVRQEVNLFLGQSLEKSFLKETENVQSSIENDEHLIGSLAGLLAINPDITGAELYPFVSAADLKKNTVSKIYIANVNGKDVHLVRELLNTIEIDSKDF
jgi:CHASE1-domain containing sensor protein